MLYQCAFVHGFCLLGVIAFVKCRATVASNFDDGDLCFGKEAYIIASGLHGLRLIKNLTPSRASPMRKRVHALRK
jgi:hypothetical protein